MDWPGEDQYAGQGRNLRVEEFESGDVGTLEMQPDL